VRDFADDNHKMRALGRRFLVLLFLNFVPAISLNGAGAAQPVRHHPHGICRNCHGSVGSQEIRSQAGEAAPKKPCIDCHREALLPSGGLPSATAYSASGHMLDTGAVDQKVAPLGGKFFDRIECLSCHVPHRQGQPKLLRLQPEAAKMVGGAILDPSTQLCLSCHSVAAEFKGLGRRYVRHPVGITINPARMLDHSKLPPLVDVRGTDDPSDDVIGCTTCHYPHASKNTFLLRWSLAELPAACLRCHPDVSPPGPGAIKGLVARR
jgi:predicted CXXCH cytochrome family protein